MRQNVVLSIAVLGIALATGCSKKPDDAAVVTDIKSQMFSDPQLKDASLQVTSSGGEVTLSGTAPSDAAHLEAYKIASQAPGVTKVNDQITVQSAQAPSAPEAGPAPVSDPAPVKPRKAHTTKPESSARVEPVAESTPPPSAPAQNAAPAQQAAPAATPAPPPPPPPPQPKQVEVPAGSTITIRMIDGVDSSVNHPGEIFHASLDAPLVVGDEVVVSKGADVYVRLVSASSAGKMTGKSELHLELIKMEYQGRSYPLVSSTYSQSGSSRGKDTAKKVGGGAVLGTLIGAIAGGGKGAAIGAGVGAAGGGIYQAATHGQQVRIPSETKLDFQLDQPVSVTVMPHKNAASE
jgi:BON domain-containing protein